MKEHVIAFAKNHPLTIEQIKQLAGFTTRNQAAVWTAQMRKQDRLTYVGSLKNGIGRPLDVLCNGWQPKLDNLRHEIKGTAFCIAYYFALLAFGITPLFRRGYYVGEFRPDIEMVIGDTTYLIEIDCGTMTKPQVKRRWQKYKKCEDTILIVAVSNPLRAIDSNERIQELIRWSPDLYEKAVFTTLEHLVSDPLGAVYWDAEESRNRSLNFTQSPTLIAT